MKLFGQEYLRFKKEPKITDPKSWNWNPAHPEWLVTDMPFPIGQPQIVHNVESTFALVIGQESAECGALVQELRNKQMPFVFINWDEQESGVFSLQLSNGTRSGKVQLGDTTLDLNDVRSVYVEPPVMMTTLERTPEEFEEAEAIFIRRWLSLLKDLPEFTPNATWYPGKPEDLLLDAQKKMTELSIAQDCGFQVPETLITNSPSEAKEFFEKHSGRVMFRDFGTQKVFKGNKVKTYDVDILKSPDENWSLISESPTVLQAYVEKTHDIRVVAIGDKVLPIKIHSQDSSKSKIDWRDYDLANVKYEVTNISNELSDSISMFLKKTGVSMGSFDIVESEGGFYFLEMNRPGSWLFMEALAGSPVTSGIADQLCQNL